MLVHTQPLNALEGVICEVELGALANIQPLDTLEVCEHCISQLGAAKQAQAVNALDVDKGSIRDGVMVDWLQPHILRL